MVNENSGSWLLGKREQFKTLPFIGKKRSSAPIYFFSRTTRLKLPKLNFYLSRPTKRDLDDNGEKVEQSAGPEDLMEDFDEGNHFSSSNFSRPSRASWYNDFMDKLVDKWTIGSEVSSSKNENSNSSK